MNKQDYDRLAEIVFRLDADGKPTYPGYRPEVLELPNGDGKVDAQKRYAHVATKYLNDFAFAFVRYVEDPEYNLLERALFDAHVKAWNVAKVLGVPDALMPSRHYGALRILEYPVGATSNLHTDMDLFSLVLYRDQPNCLSVRDQRDMGLSHPTQWKRLKEARKLNAQLHIGELGELIGLGPATPHEVIASDKPQHAIVYFAIPSHDAVLPQPSEKLLADGPLTVGEWLTERMARSRTYK